MRLIEIYKGTFKQTVSSGSKSINNIKQMLRSAGYTDEQINIFRSKDLIVISPATLSRTLKRGDTLYILDLEEPIETPKTIDRFSDL